MIYLIVQMTGSDLICAQFEKGRRELRFIGGSRQTLGGENTLESVLTSEKARIAGDYRVVLVLPPHHLYLRELELPITDRRKLRDILPLELRGETVLDADHLSFDAIPMAENKVLAVWGKTEELAGHIRIMAELGLEPIVVTAAMFSWQKLLPADAQEGVIAICDSESLAVYDNAKPLFFRSLAQGEPLQEANRTLAALRLGKEIVVERVYYHGAAVDKSSSHLYPENQGGVSISPLPPNPELVSLFGDDRSTYFDLASCYAVVKNCIDGDPLNFRHGPLAYRAGEELIRRKLIFSSILAGILALLLCLEVGIRYYQVKKDLQSLNASIGGIYKEIFPTRKKPVDPVSEIRSEIKRLSASSSGSILDNLNRLASAKGDDINSLYEIEFDGGQVRLKGDARSTQAVNDFKGRLTSFLGNIEVGEIKSRPDGSVSFSIRGMQQEGKQ